MDRAFHVRTFIKRSLSSLDLTKLSNQLGISSAESSWASPLRALLPLRPSREDEAGRFVILRMQLMLDSSHEHCGIKGTSDEIQNFPEVKEGKSETEKSTNAAAAAVRALASRDLQGLGP